MTSSIPPDVFRINQTQCMPFSFYLSDAGRWMAEALVQRVDGIAGSVMTRRVHWTLESAVAELLELLEPDLARLRADEALDRPGPAEGVASAQARAGYCSWRRIALGEAVMPNQNEWEQYLWDWKGVCPQHGERGCSCRADYLYSQRCGPLIELLEPGPAAGGDVSDLFPEIDIARWRPQDGDVAVVTCRWSVQQDQIANMKQEWIHIFEGATPPRLLILDRDVTLAVLRADEALALGGSVEGVASAQARAGYVD